MSLEAIRRFGKDTESHFRQAFHWKYALSSAKMASSPAYLQFANRANSL